MTGLVLLSNFVLRKFSTQVPHMFLVSQGVLKDAMSETRKTRTNLSVYLDFGSVTIGPAVG